MNVTLRELLYDEDFIAKLYGWSYNHTYERADTEELCQEIILQLLIASQSIEYNYTYAYIWKIADNTYNRMVRQKYKHNDCIGYESYMNVHTDMNMEDDIITAITDNDYLQFIQSQIMFMSKIYREVMIMFYFDGVQMTEIAERLDVPLNRVKQRLHSAKEKIKKEVNNMSDNNIALKPYNLIAPGSGNPLKSNVREQLNSIIAQNIAISCRDHAKTPSEIAVELSIPTVYIENQLELMVGEAIKKCDDGKYIANFIAISYDDFMIMNDDIKMIVKDYIKDMIAFLYNKKDEIMNWDYLNIPKSFEFILWSILPKLEIGLQSILHNSLNTHYREIKIEEREFKILGIFSKDGIVDLNMYGHNGLINDSVQFWNFTGERLPGDKSRFGYGENVPEHILFTFKCIGGYDKSLVNDDEKEILAKALDFGYVVLADDGKYYPNVIIFDKKNPVHDLTIAANDSMKKHSETLINLFVEFIDKHVPQHLLNQRDIFIDIITMPVRYYNIEEAIAQGALYIPQGDTIVEGIYGVRL